MSLCSSVYLSQMRWCRFSELFTQDIAPIATSPEDVIEITETLREQVESALNSIGRLDALLESSRTRLIDITMSSK